MPRSKSPARLKASTAEDGSKEAKKGVDMALVLIVASFVLSSSGNSIAGKRMANKLEQHMFFITLIAVFVLTAFFFALSRILNPRGLPASSTAFPKHKFVFMAVGDTLQMVLIMLASAKVPGSIQRLLGKAVIPITLLTKYLSLIHI